MRIQSNELLNIVSMSNRLGGENKLWGQVSECGWTTGALLAS